MKEMLREKGFKATPVRLAVLGIFLKHKIPLNAGTVFTKIVKKLKKTNEATVYRTLLSLEKGGILKRVDVRKDSVYFELSTNHHHHMFCITCSTIEDFEDSELEKVIEKIIGKSTKFKKIKDHSLELFGLCRACA